MGYRLRWRYFLLLILMVSPTILIMSIFLRPHASIDQHRYSQQQLRSFGKISRPDKRHPPHKGKPSNKESNPTHFIIDRYDKEETKLGPGGTNSDDVGSKSNLGFHGGQKYLFPLLDYGENGPGWWMLQIRFAIQVAIHYNRTLVVVPMKAHYNDNEPHKMIPFAETFDEKVLSQMLPIISPEDYKKVCDFHVRSEDLIIAPFSDTSRGYESRKKGFTYIYNEYCKLYTHLFQISLPNIDSIPSSQSEYMERLDSLKNRKCVALYHPNFLKIDLPEGDALTDLAAVGLAKAAYIRELVDGLEAKMCDGEPFIALHWRNKTGERFMNSATGPLMPSREEVNYMIELSPQISEAIVNYMHSVNVTCIYVSHPPFQQQILVDLKSKLPSGQVIDQADVIKYKEMAPFAENTYLLSLIEQEICLRSKIYLPWFNYGSWSTFVNRERTAHGLPNKVLSYLPGMVKDVLSWE